MSDNNKKNNNIVSKSEIVKRITSQYNDNIEKTESSKKEISENLVNTVVTHFLDEILNSVTEGYNVVITKFFSIKSKLSKARKSRNFQTQKEILIPERVTPRIIFSLNFKNKVKEGRVSE